MAEYRFFRMNGWGVVDTGGYARFTDDASALGHAREMGHAGKVEVWAGPRRVGVVLPTGQRVLVDRRAS